MDNLSGGVFSVYQTIFVCVAFGENCDLLVIFPELLPNVCTPVCFYCNSPRYHIGFPLSFSISSPFLNETTHLMVLVLYLVTVLINV